MASRRINPRLLAAFEEAGVEPLDFDTPGRVVEVPVPPEHFASQPETAPAPAPAPKSRLQMIQEFLASQPKAQPPTFAPGVDPAAASQVDAQQNLGRSMLAAGAAFGGNRNAVLQQRPSNANEAAALGEQARRQKMRADWAEGQSKRQMDEAELLSAASVEPREASKSARTTEQIDRELDIKAQDSETRRKNAEKVKPAKPVDPAALRKEFNALPEVKQFQEVDTAFRKIQAAAKNHSAAGDLSLIFAYMKVLDPGSTVREGEFANAQAAAGADQRLLGAIKKVQSGERLSDEQRADFVRQAGQLYEAHRSQFSSSAKRYQGFATKKGLAPEDVAVDVKPQADGAAPADDKRDGKVPMVTAKGLTIWVTPETAAAGEKAKTLRKP